MVQYKLYYFDLKGLGELIRLIFAAAEQEYEDVRFSREKWPEHKPKAPFGKSPFLEVIDGSNTVTYAQSKAIARYLAGKFGLAGKNDEESAIIDMYADQIADLIPEIIKVKHTEGIDEKKKKELEEKFEKEILPVHLKYYDERMGQSGSGYIVSSGLSWADLYLFSFSHYFPNRDKLLQQYKNVKANHEKIEANPGIAKWLKTRPVTEF